MMNQPVSLTRLDRSRGALLGLAAGDAVGTTVEFATRGEFTPLTDMVGGGPFHLEPGQWTDDTSMALCLAASLLDEGFDLHDQIQRYLLWKNAGYMSSTGACFDIGMATAAALARYTSGDSDPKAGSTHPRSAGNGSIMRLAPVPIHYLATPEQAIELSAEQSQTTHRAPECLMACRLFAEVLVRALQGHSKSEVLAPSMLVQPLTDGLSSISRGDYKSLSESQIHGTGYVVQSLEAALWCFWKTDSFRDCILLAANLGDDADTTAAIAGQVAGAFYGEQGIPRHWLAQLAMAEEIGMLAERLVRRVPKI